jgi:hypothetical protein
VLGAPVSIFIFSDDPEWAAHKIPTISPRGAHLVSCPDAVSDHEQLCLLSMCAHKVIANSSFSWWAAWLGLQWNGLVFAPAKWAVGERNRAGPVLDSWIRVNS